MPIRKVGVVGCGLMGSGIAQVSAQAGFPTVVREVSQPLLDKGMGAIKKFLQGGVDKGKLAAADMEKTLANLTGTVRVLLTAFDAMASEPVYEPGARVPGSRLASTVRMMKGSVTTTWASSKVA